MPYITQEIRLPIDDHETKPQGCGGLSYKLTAVVREYLDQHPNDDWNEAIAHVLAALEGVRIEFEQDLRITIQSEESKLSALYPAGFPAVHL
jgi:hypothetical protein